MEPIITVVGIFLAFVVFGMMVQEHVKEKNRKITKAAIELEKSIAILDDNMEKLQGATLAMVDMVIEIVKTNDINFSPRFKEILKKANEDIRKDDKDNNNG